MKTIDVVFQEVKSAILADCQDHCGEVPKEYSVFQLMIHGPAPVLAAGVRERVAEKLHLAPSVSYHRLFDLALDEIILEMTR